MGLSAGMRLGPYQIVSALGAGGMGEVYRARDSRLDRDVAIKILPEAFAADGDRVARFEREAKVLASLNHPHIGAIYGLEEAAGVTGLVMEFVEGEDLSQRLARGAIPLDEALLIAKQIAEALEVAHEHGIIHRDLKPANIKVRNDGAVKVLDFGLAKAADPPFSASGAAALANSPTITNVAGMTAAGIILGTAAYMSPEQARGRAVDKRTDLWAFGCVLYEMLTGVRPFGGDDVTDTIAAVVRAEPDWSKLSPQTPTAIRRLLRRCLEKDRMRRLADAADARLDIDEALHPVASDAPTDHRAPVGAAGGWRRALPWAFAGSLAVTLAVVLVLWAPWREAPTAAAVRLSADVGADMSLGELLPAAPGDSMSLSPDGTIVAFVAQKIGEASPRLYVRRLAQLETTRLSGTEDAIGPFFSPDGQWIAFFAGGKLKKIPVMGGAAVPLCDAAGSRGGAWGDDGSIVFQPNLAGGLMRVSSLGGRPEPLTTLAEGEISHRWPQVLPGSRTVLYTANGSVGAYDDANIVVQTLPTGPRTVLQRGGYHGRYLPSGLNSAKRGDRDGGHLVYVHDASLFAIPFDLARMTIAGPTVPALEGLTSNAGSGSAQFEVSATGTLVYRPGRSTDAGLPIQWIDRQSRTTILRSTPANWSNLAFAPDGHQLAFQSTNVGPPAVWTYDWARDALARVTTAAWVHVKPVWTPDSRRIVFGATPPGRSTPNLHWKRSDGTGDEQRLADSPNAQVPGSWHPSGKFLAFEQVNPGTDSDILILPVEGDDVSGWKPGKATTFLDSPSVEHEPMFSPDGRFIAYSSNEAGRTDVYVRPFPGPGGKWTISSGGGFSPTWSRTKREIFYATLGGQIMVARYALEGDSMRVEKPQLWSEAHFRIRGLNRMFDLHPDGERFALAVLQQTPGDAKQDHITFVFNFFDELRRIAPPTK